MWVPRQVVVVGAGAGDGGGRPCAHLCVATAGTLDAPPGLANKAAMLQKQLQTLAELDGVSLVPAGVGAAGAGCGCA